MDSMSHKASRFVVVASFPPAAGVGAKEAAPTKAYTFTPDTTISEVFQAIWPSDPNAEFFFTEPSKIEIVPDETAIPERPESDIFGANLEPSKNAAAT
ncbi:hypothetical protein [Rhizobium favelukesii]|uniref:hypothetical protein n=1 Tax=Rhizobium favelukesii TaxID=348824 RepID=UPI000562C8D7|nr:hypothetical protein [Rhizobium favelukesii]MCS0459946.1 hypothetical protein [Rhizobium favelukesii]